MTGNKYCIFYPISSLLPLLYILVLLIPNTTSNKHHHHHYRYQYYRRHHYATTATRRMTLTNSRSLRCAWKRLPRSSSPRRVSCYATTATLLATAKNGKNVHAEAMVRPRLWISFARWLCCRRWSNRRWWLDCRSSTHPLTPATMLVAAVAVAAIARLRRVLGCSLCAVSWTTRIMVRRFCTESLSLIPSRGT